MARVRTRLKKKKKNTVKYFYILFSCIFIIGLVFLIYKATHSKPTDQWSEYRIDNTPKVTLPADDATHDAQIEWWYYNGHLISESGKQYSFHDTVFLVKGVMNHMMSHVSFSDYQTKKHFTDQRRTGGNASTSIANGFEFKQGNWSMLGSGGKDQLKINTQDFAFDLQLQSTQDVVFHGQDGIISLASAGDSYYYSRARMAISGDLSIAGHTEKVTGVSWFDHQWGDFSVGQLAWDWFSLQLDNGMDVMIYQLRDKANNPVLYTASVTEKGKTELFSGDDFILTPGKKWISSKTGYAYPIIWDISIPKKNIAITTQSIIPNCEFDARLTTYNVYWEGAVNVKGSHTGRGFMELSGYTNK